jgi:hypothetical protein
MESVANTAARIPDTTASRSVAGAAGAAVEDISTG